tara:strand:- start:377 stop:856 length:480 start_codon:yes stop_codon:yes gene_type:complete
MSKNQIGSSTMPQKNNPIYFEKAEANLLLSNCLWNLFSNTLPISRMQRDLRDSSLLRNVGSAFSYMYISLSSIETGINKLDINNKVINEDLKKSYNVVLEGILSRLKVVSNINCYKSLKDISNNKNSIEEFIENLRIDEDERKYLKTCKPDNFTGIYKL